MSFFEDMKANLTQAGQKTAQKAKDITETASLNKRNGDNEKQIKELLFQVGTKMYDLYSAAPPKGFEEIFFRISELKREIAENEARLAELNTAAYCPVCGDKLRMDAAFCSNCGFQIADQRNVCTACGRKVDPQASFCPGCGTRLNG